MVEGEEEPDFLEEEPLKVIIMIVMKRKKYWLGSYGGEGLATIWSLVGIIFDLSWK